MKEIIYLDYHATTPCDPKVVEVMLPYFSEAFGNPSSSVHAMGRRAAEAVEAAREQVAALIGARKGEVIFTGGATESNNLAILGVARASKGGRKGVVTCAIEHKSVLLPCKELAKSGFDAVVLQVDRYGRVPLDALEAVLNQDTLLVSIQSANNEIGTIQPIPEIAALAHAHGALVHCDAAQSVGKVPVDVAEWDVDFLSISAHKLYGPKGVGALYIKGGPYAQPIEPLVIGGGQEWELRAGTVNVPGIVGFGQACLLAGELLEEEAARVGELRDYMEAKLRALIPGIRFNGDPDSRLPGNSSVTLPGIEVEALIARVPSIALSTGSACTSGAPEPSKVLQALGMTRHDAYSTVRVGLGRFTTREQIDRAVDSIYEGYRKISPVAHEQQS